ncbi:MAG: hypothetical protein M3437_07505 [Chloroflexota bacterium]|nr:hypothetical protein [Chloroflexota bacterium]MDQ5867954.1 hypothetical protein [Chloroflexota bacterium]
MKTGVFARLFPLMLGACLALLWGGFAPPVARATNPSTGAVLAPAGTQFRDTAGVAANQEVSGRSLALYAMLNYIRAQRYDGGNPNLQPPVDGMWMESRVNELPGVEQYLYSSGAWSVTVSYPVVPEPIYSVTVGTTFNRRSNLSESWTWKGRVDATGRVTDVSHEVMQLPLSGFGPTSALDAMLDYMRAQPSAADPNMRPPTLDAWTETLLTDPASSGPRVYGYTAGAWEATVSAKDAPAPLYEVVVRTSFQKGNTAQSFQWTGHVDGAGSILYFVVVGSAEDLSHHGMPKTGDGPGVDLPAVLLVASLLSILGAGVIIRLMGRVRPADDTYILK